MALSPDEPPRDWSGAVAVHADGRRVGWVNGGGEEMRRALREIAARGLYVVVSGVVETVQGAPAVRLSLPWPAEIVAWLGEGAPIADGLAVRPVQVISTGDDGLVVRGRRLPLAEVLYAAGTPPVWGLAKRPEPSERVAAVRIDDVLVVEEDERGWTVSDGAGVLGRLRWRRGDNGKPHSASGAVIRYPARGRLLVFQVTEVGGRVVDFGGVVVEDRPEA
ncbi:hypothetical protein [Actinotalea sp. Marseille-Q4924]|uniref:hypothetical protein n=1 Tax=Actinotalea sp. Marseille-Q4924 TaxID=2866571 RepID=UPI001CE43A6C|nr:hypothetical protein [Actinotalea sp. Marseille-Q4924]